MTFSEADKDIGYNIMHLMYTCLIFVQFTRFSEILTLIFDFKDMVRFIIILLFVAEKVDSYHKILGRIVLYIIY
jgi:hypothetical protein